ncbi:Protein unc-13-like protein C [Armadillidium vulgare]|nr:Protein unc-13-like protein C [Armadillidium vulgare]
MAYDSGGMLDLSLKLTYMDSLTDKKGIATKSNPIVGPTVNESANFCVFLNWIFLIGSEDTPDSFELHICIKDYCFARENRLDQMFSLTIRR